MRKTISCLLMVLAVPALGQATDDSKENDSKTGGSNIGLAQYPGPNCTKPQLPVQPSAKLAEAPDAAEANAYNAKVRQFNRDVAGYNGAMTVFNACMKSYVENGDADMQRIKQKLDEAVAAANARQ